MIVHILYYVVLLYIAGILYIYYARAWGLLQTAHSPLRWIWLARCKAGLVVHAGFCACKLCNNVDIIVIYEHMYICMREIPPGSI